MSPYINYRARPIQAHEGWLAVSGTLPHLVIVLNAFV
jgi:hypothetical protein